ncbi:MAG: type II toxin-antitoxin system RelE/ParE family toxin [Prevotellaceae bacterium]|jgi:mRNA interferase RelE/StbE|nr:type II toxin-antitoxin system RelE/ParE family toxin [Prevotellaceae bacterium]
MPKYTLYLSSKARSTLDKLSDHIAAPILKAIASLETNPYPIGYKKLRGREGYRIRTGNYRIIYSIEHDRLIITVIAIGHRKDIYKK